MNKNRADEFRTKLNGYRPGVLAFDGDDYMDLVLDESIVEYGTGCWIYTGGSFVNAGPEPFEAQLMVYNMFKGGVPTGHVVYNICSDYRICLNPNCLDTTEEASSA